MPEELRCVCCGECAYKRCAECRLVAYCSKECQKKDWKNHRKSECLRSEKIEEVVDSAGKEVKVAVRKSPVHGRGVFATADILSGERVCFFDGEDRSLRFRVTMVRRPPSIKGGDEDTLGIKNAAAAFEHTMRGLRDLDMFAKHPGKADVVRIGRRDEPRSDFGVGQFINDGAVPALREPAALDFSAGYDRLKEYLAASERRANVTMSAAGYWFAATRRLRRGEELFTHYGFEFWLQKFLLEAGEPVRRFYYYSLMDQRTKPFNLTLLYQYDSPTCREFLRTVLGDERADETEDPKWELLKLSERINLQ